MNYYYTAGDVMDDAQASLNDVQAGVFNYSTLFPYLKMAMRSFEQELNLNDFQINLVTNDEIVVPAGAKDLTLPANFFCPITLMERQNGTTDRYMEMKQRWNVDALQVAPIDTLTYWTWEHNDIRFIGSHTQDRQVQLTYYRFLTEFADETSIADVRGGRNYLQFRTAALAARLIGQNQGVANDLDALAQHELDLFLGNIAKVNQGMRTRRRPFRTKQPNPPLLVRIP